MAHCDIDDAADAGCQHPRGDLARHQEVARQVGLVEVFVTGGTSGLGLAMASALTSAGSTVALTGDPASGREPSPPSYLVDRLSDGWTTA